MSTNDGEQSASRDLPTGTPQERRSASTTVERQPLSAKEYVVLSCVVLLATVVLLAGFVLVIPYLQKYNVSGRVYYVVLVILGLGSAAFVFGAMRSYAHFTGAKFSQGLELGGPIVGAALVVFGGLYAVPAADTFYVTIRVFGPDKEGPDNGVIKSGLITLLLASDSRSQPIGTNGEANFKEIPIKFKGQEIEVLAEIEGYKLPKRQYVLDENLRLVLETASQPSSVPKRPADTFSATIRVFGPDDLVIQAGRITLLLGSDSRSQPIASNGEANFKEIPIKFRGQEIEVLAEIEGYKLPKRQYVLDENLRLVVETASQPPIPKRPQATGSASNRQSNPNRNTDVSQVIAEAQTEYENAHYCSALEKCKEALLNSPMNSRARRLRDQISQTLRSLHMNC